MTINAARPTRDLERIWDRNFETEVVRLLPGDYYVSQSGEVLTTVLGSCISACIRDVECGVGGMNHFMLPGAKVETVLTAESAGRYGSHAMKFLVEDIMRLGGSLQKLEVKLFGGGQIVKGMVDVGERNIQFARQYLAAAGIPIAAEDLGLTFPRKINYSVQSGRVMVKRLRPLHARSIVAEEQAYCRGIVGTNAE